MKLLLSLTLALVSACLISLTYLYFLRSIPEIQNKAKEIHGYGEPGHSLPKIENDSLLLNLSGGNHIFIIDKATARITKIIDQ